MTEKRFKLLSEGYEREQEELAEIEKVRQRRAKGREKWRRAQKKKKHQEQKTA